MRTNRICFICGSEQISLDELREHHSTNHPDATFYAYVCKDCPRGFKSANGLRRHRLDEHSNHTEADSADEQMVEATQVLQARKRVRTDFDSVSMLKGINIKNELAGVSF